MSDSDDGWERVAAAIRRRMTEHQITPAELIRRSKISDKTLSGYLAGKPIVRQDKRWAMCKALMWTPDSIERILRGDPPLDTLKPSTYYAQEVQERLATTGEVVEFYLPPTDVVRALGDLLNDIAQIRIWLLQMTERLGMDDLNAAIDAGKGFVPLDVHLHVFPPEALDEDFELAAETGKPSPKGGKRSRPQPDPEPDEDA